MIYNLAIKIWCLGGESNSKRWFTKPLLYHLTNQAAVLQIVQMEQL